MTDPELDALLRRYRPAGPPPELRARVVASEPPAVRAWPWAAAAAILLAAVCAMQLSTREVYRGVRQGLGAIEVSSLDELPALRSAVGDDELLRQLLEMVRSREASETAASPIESGPSWQ